MTENTAGDRPDPGTNHIRSAADFLNALPPLPRSLFSAPSFCFKFFNILPGSGSRFSDSHRQPRPRISPRPPVGALRLRDIGIPVLPRAPTPFQPGLRDRLGRAKCFRPFRCSACRMGPVSASPSMAPPAHPSSAGKREGLPPVRFGHSVAARPCEAGRIRFSRRFRQASRTMPLSLF